jgi:hypothetical protein
VRWQCAMIDFSLTKELHPVPIGLSQVFSFYPVFLSAAHERFLLDSRKDLPAYQRKNDSRHYYYLKDKAFSMLRSSDIIPMLREYYLWHMEDGLP